VEAGKMELELERTDIGELLDNSVLMLKGRASSHQIRLDVESDVSDPVAVDRRKTRQIVYNLLSNAVKFTPDGGTVVLRAHRVAQVELAGMQRVGDAPLADGNGYLELSVVDTGIGIAPEDIGRLFRPFSQLDSGLARKYEGTGLGLVLVKQLVELHGGTVAVASRVGQGTTFKVWLPYREPAPATPAPTEALHT
ncbi:MAG TPA: ATP-binding protein, partial [Albitalea sp.]|nr:ATP-binding protein [Albitalea sp.]